MKIGINATLLATPYKTGLKNYTENLITNLSHIDHKNTYFVFVTKGARILLPKNFNFIDIPTIPIFKRQILLALLARKCNLDVFHFLEPYGSIFINYSNIITTVPDLNLNETYPLISRYFINRFFCQVTRHFVFRNTKAYIPISNTIKRELKKYLGNTSGKSINTIYMGIDKNFKPSKSTVNFKKYFLTMGDFAPRKNTTAVIKAYALLPKEIRNKYSLRIITSTLSSVDKFKSVAIKSGVNSNIKILKNISNARLIENYNNAMAFIFPSLYEGFGLPILEAMACGCPVITSNYGAMKEVAGDAAILVSPRSTKSILNGIFKIVNNEELRKSFVKKGIRRASLYSWEKTARATLSIYESFNPSKIL